jgi:hypothetical protein
LAFALLETVAVWGRLIAPTASEILVVGVKTATTVGETTAVIAGVAVGVAVGVAGSGVAVTGGVGAGVDVRVAEGSCWTL